MGITRKYYSLVAFFLLLVTALIIFLTRRDGTLAERHSNFIPADVSTIDRIVISRGEDTIALEEEGQKWTLNEVSVVREDRLEFLLASLARLEIVSPVSRLLEKEVIEHLMAYGKRVQLYVQGKLDKDFLVCYDTTAIAGTYMMLERSEIPYMVRLKGYSGLNIENIFSVNLKSWKENVLFDLVPAEIREIIVEYPDEPFKSFRIFRSNDEKLVLSDLSTIIPDERTDVQEISDYLYFFNSIRFEFVTGTIPESILSGTPFAVLHISTLSNQIIHLKAYRLPASSDSPDEYSIKQFIGLANQDTVVLNYTDMDPIFRQLKDFQKN